MKKLLTPIASIAASIILFAGVPLIYAWTGPASTPPAGNVSAPVNIGASSQNKSGVLGLGGLAVFGKTLITQVSGYSLPTANTNMLLGVNGAIGASQSCDQNGQNCVTTLGGAMSSGSNSTTTSGASGRSVICGGFLTRYSDHNPGPSPTANYIPTAGYNGLWGCATQVNNLPQCPSGYDALNTARLTSNGAEQTWMCVINSI